MRKVLLTMTIATTLAIGCKNDSEAPNSAPTPADSISYTSKEGTLITNGIALQARGVKVDRAFLLYDNSTLVPPDNKTSEGRTIKLRLMVRSGWVEEDGKVSLGAAETIRTDKGQVVLNEEDLFATAPLLDAQAAKAITLTATISKLGRQHSHFIVSFRVWDKRGEGEIEGNYKLLVE